MEISRLSTSIKFGLRITSLLAILFLNFSMGGTQIAYAAPSNDLIGNATQIFGLVYSDSVDTTTATEGGTDPDPVGPCTDGQSLVAGYKSVWYKYTPPVAQSIQVDTMGTNYDTYVAVFTGTEGNLNLVICNDDGLGGFSSRLSFIGAASTQYYFEVAQFKCNVGNCGSPQPSTGGNLSFNVNITNTDVKINGILMDSYYVPDDGSIRDDYAGVDNGPVEIKNVVGTPIVAGLNEIRKNGLIATSSFQIMAMPSTLLSNKYVFPAYNNVTLDEQLRFSNVGNADTTVTVTIGGNLMGSYLLHPNEQRRENYAGVDSGPVVVQGSNPNVDIVAAIRDVWFTGGVVESFSQLMGLPDTLLSNKYVFPAYNNVNLDDQLRFGNVGNADTTVTVTIGGSVMGSYLLHPNEQRRENYAGVDSGPVVVEGSNPNVPIIAAIRGAWFNGTVVESWVQLMGLPASQVSHKYLFPAYDNVTVNGQLRFGNIGNADTTVTVTIAGQVQDSYLLHPNEQKRVDYPLDNGPVVVEGSNPNVPIIAALRDALFINGVVESFAQMMGLPASQLSDTFVLPAYNNVTLSEELRFGVP